LAELAVKSHGWLGFPTRDSSAGAMKNADQNWRIAVFAAVVFALDQLTKVAVLRFMEFGEQEVIIEGFFKFVYWGNTGAAWSMFQGKNAPLAVVGLIALIILVLTRSHFDVHTLFGQLCLGLILGGILGNVTDRLRVNHVIDFLYFYVICSDHSEAGFPAFNVADTAICTGVGLLFLLSLRNGTEKNAASVENKP
jgi:signal peptidase II